MGDLINSIRIEKIWNPDNPDLKAQMQAKEKHGNVLRWFKAATSYTKNKERLQIDLPIQPGKVAMVASSAIEQMSQEKIELTWYERQTSCILKVDVANPQGADPPKLTTLHKVNIKSLSERLGLHDKEKSQLEKDLKEQNEVRHKMHVLSKLLSKPKQSQKTNLKAEQFARLVEANERLHKRIQHVLNKHIGQAPPNAEESLVIATETVEQYKQAAELGSATAQAKLGWLYENGQGVEQNKENAIELYQKAAAQNNAEAQYRLGSLYAIGQGSLERNQEQAAEYYLLAARQGNADAQCALGLLYATHAEAAPRESKSVQDTSEEKSRAQDLKEALKWWKRAAAQGHPSALYYLGNLYQSRLGLSFDLGSTGPTLNHQQAEKYYRKAAEAGHIGAFKQFVRLHQGDKGLEKQAQHLARQYQQAADLGDATARIKLALLYQFGIGVEKSASNYQTHLKLAADQGDSNAQIRQSNFEKDNEAIRLWQLAISQGNARAAYVFSIYEQEKHHSLKMIKLLKLAADLGDPSAQCDLGILYEKGHEIAQDKEEAVRLYQLAAIQGDPRAQYALANLLYPEEVNDGTMPNPEKIRLLRMAAFEGSADAQNLLGNIYKNGKRFFEAEKFYQLALKQADGNDQERLNQLNCALGSLYYARKEELLEQSRNHGTDHSQTELNALTQQAKDCWELAAHKGDPEAQERLGSLYELGNQGIKKNEKEAFKLYELAAKQGNPDAMAGLSRLYLNGRGVEKDEEKGLRYVTLSMDRRFFLETKTKAEQGDLQEQYKLGLLYQNGEGVEKDETEAERLFTDAANQGHEQAEEALEKMREKA